MLSQCRIEVAFEGTRWRGTRDRNPGITGARRQREAGEEMAGDGIPKGAGAV